MLLNESKRELKNALGLLNRIENFEVLFVYLTGAKTFNDFNARAKDLKLYEKLLWLIVEHNFCKKPYDKSIKVSAQFEQSIMCDSGAIMLSCDFFCAYSTRHGSNTNKINYSISFDQHYLTIKEAEELFKQMLMNIEMEELS